MKFKKQVYQTNAVDAVADCFANAWPDRELMQRTVAQEEKDATLHP